MKTTKRKLQVALTIISLTSLVFLAVGYTRRRTTTIP